MSALSHGAAFLDEIHVSGTPVMLATIQRAEELAAQVGQSELAGELLAIRTYVGSHAVPPRDDIRDLTAQAERYRLAILDALRMPLSDRLWGRAEIRYNILLRMIDALKRRARLT